MKVEILHETRRGCGFRKPSKDGVGVYLRGSPFNEACERLPWLLERCPCCGGGITFSRSFTWIDPMSMFNPFSEPACTVNLADDPFHSHRHEQCWMCNPELLGSKAGLLWIGEKFYSRPQDFLREAEVMGISRKIAALPNGFEVGVHVIFLAHIRTFSKRLPDGKMEYQAGVFAAFKPSSVDLVIDNDSRIPDKALNLMKKLGDKGRLVKVIPDTEGELVGQWDDLEDF